MSLSDLYVLICCGLGNELGSLLHKNHQLPSNKGLIIIKFIKQNCLKQQLI